MTHLRTRPSLILPSLTSNRPVAQTTPPDPLPLSTHVQALMYPRIATGDQFSVSLTIWASFCHCSRLSDDIHNAHTPNTSTAAHPEPRKTSYDLASNSTTASTALSPPPPPPQSHTLTQRQTLPAAPPLHRPATINPLKAERSPPATARAVLPLKLSLQKQWQPLPPLINRNVLRRVLRRGSGFLC